MDDYEFNLPWPPTVNHYHQPIRRGKGVRIIKGAKAREYAKEAGKVIDTIGLSNEQIDVKVYVYMVLHPPTLAAYDVDGRPKGVLDALTEAGFWVDDSQVHRMTVEKGEKVKGGMVSVSVTLMGDL